MEKGKMNTRMNKEKTNQDPTNKDTERPFQRAHTHAQELKAQTNTPFLKKRKKKNNLCLPKDKL